MHRRIVRAVVIAVILIAAVVEILTFVDFTAPIEEAKRCAPSIWKTQWPRYIGCVAGARGDLAAGLIGVAGALFAAWLAFAAVMAQIANETNLRNQQLHDDEGRIRRQQANAKRAAKACILPAIRAAGVAILAVNRAINNPVGTETSLQNAFNHIRMMLDTFGLKESVQELATEDRISFFEIIGTLSTLISVHEYGQSPYGERCKALQSGLVTHHGGALSNPVSRLRAGTMQ